jgi:hypothetical protein
MGATTRDDVKARPGEEVWETTTEATSWFRVTDDRGRERSMSVGGKVGARLRITTVDREINQDLAMYGHDAFTSGLLRRVDDTTANSPNTMTDQELTLGFSKAGRAFQAFVDKLTELNVRRMRGMSTDVDATVAQVSYLDQVIKEKFRIEGDTPSYREYKQLT